MAPPTPTTVVPVYAADGTTSALLAYPAPDPSEAPVLLWFPAMGVSAGYYAPFAERLSASGVNVAVADLRGIGRSAVRASRRSDFGFREMVMEDVPAAVDTVRREFPGCPVFIGGHSIGGLLCALHVGIAPARAEGIVLVACGTPYFRLWPFLSAAKIFFFGLLMRLIAEGAGHLPARLSFAGREARGVIRDWHALVLRGRFRIRGFPTDPEQALAGLSLPVLAVSFADDQYTPGHTVRHFTSKLAAARLTHLDFKPEEHGGEPLGHVRWVKSAPWLAERVAGWLVEQVDE